MLIKFNWKIRKKFQNAYFKTYFCFNNSHIEPAIENYGDNKDTLFDEIYKNVQSTSITRNMFINDIIVIFAAATDTTGTVLESALLWLSKHPHLQNKIYNELLQHSKANSFDHDCGNNCDAHRHDSKKEYKTSEYKQCVHFRALINEALRLSCVVPRPIPRRVSTRCVLKFDIDNHGGCCNILFDKESNDEIKNQQRQFCYKFEKSFMIEQNLLYSMTYNNKIWGQHPSKFDISRWVDSKQEELQFINHRESTPFSCGPRNCVGMIIAMKAIRIILPNLILNYKFQSKSANKDIMFKNTFTRTVLPQQPLIVKLRKQG